MHRLMSLWFPVTVLAMLLIIMGCRAAAPTATPVPPAPTKAPAVATVAPAPAATTVPTVVAPTVAKGRLSDGVKAFLAKYPQITYMTELKPPTTPPKYGGTFSASGTGTVLHWDPVTTANSASAACYGGLLRSTVDKFGGFTGHIIGPDAAESWKRLDELTWEFKLNPNVYWHDRAPVNGRRVTAEDIKYNLEQYRDKSVYRGSFKVMSEVIIKDPQTIVVKTSEPFADMIALVAGMGIQFTAPEMETQPGGIKAWCVGYGPFKLVQFTPNENVLWERNPKYHLKGHTGLQLPYLDKLSRLKVSDPAAQYASFITGQAHVWVANSPGEMKKVVEQCPTCWGALSGGTSWDHHIAMNLTKPPFNDVRVRRALSMGVDRKTIAESIWEGVAYPSNQVLMDAMGIEYPLTLEERGKYMQYNLTEAKRLLSEAGYPNGFKATLEIGSSLSGPYGLTELEVIQFNWKKELNVDVAFKSLESLTWTQNFYNKKYEDMTFRTTVTLATGWDSATYAVYHSKSPTNFYNINDPEMDKWLEVTRREFDPVKRRDAFWKVFDLEEENIYWLNIVTNYRTNHLRPEVENVSPSLYSWIFSFSTRSMETAWIK
ncbi:MAG: ABC transporter substrate-binding protein [Chloroflexi bacterium]|nr:ABC transporter substrate-binding protein [Chloroflexota bacterium]